MSVRNLGQMRSTITRRLGASPQVTSADVTAALNDIHRQVASGFQWSLRRREQAIQTVAIVTTGTVAVMQGSPTVVGTGTAWTTAMIGRQITIPGEQTFFYIQNVADATHLTLGDADGNIVTWVGPTASGQAHTIFQSVFAVPANVAQIMYQDREFPVREVSSQWIDTVDPQRTSQGSTTPTNWAWVRTGVVSNVSRRYLEFWPVPATAITLRMPYLLEPADMANDNDLPVCPSEILEWWAVMDLSYGVHAKTGDARWVRQAESARTFLYGDAQKGEEGVIKDCIMYDLAQFGIPRQLGDTGMAIGYDLLAKRDWAVAG